MSLKYKVTEVPEGLDALYKKVDDGFVLDVEDAVEKTAFESVKSQADDYKKKVDEFRTNNILLKKQLEGTSSQASTDVDVDQLIEEKVSEMRKQLDTLTNERKVLASQLEEVVLSERVKDIAIRHGVYETALPDVVTRARNVFTVKDGKPVPVDSKSRDENGEVYTPESWLNKLASDAPHLFKPSTGTGATRSVNGVGGNRTMSSTDKIASGLGTLKSKAKNTM
jgi:hypothetical protein